MKSLRCTEYKMPNEIVGKRSKVHVNMRISHPILTWIDAEASAVGIDRTEMVEEVLTDYRLWVEKNRKPAKRSRRR